MKNNVRHSFLVLVCSAIMALANPALSSTFDEDLERVDEAIRTNPSGALRQSLLSCRDQRNYAVELRKMGMATRAQRALQYCFDSLHIPRTGAVNKTSAITLEELRARANQEYNKALALKPDVANGLAIYRECAACHQPEGWGSTTGSVPQIAGQHRTVVIKQLADFRAANRDSVLMAPYAAVEVIGNTQAVADVAAYISTLEISTANGKGPGTDLALGESLYREHCTACHGQTGEGNNDDHVPRIQAQHYKYLVRQFQWIRDGKRRNVSKEMTSLSQKLSNDEMNAVLDYSSRLLPAKELRAPVDWKNPDFK